MKIFSILFALALIGLTVRGNIGNPTASEIDLELNNSGQAFETSQERSRYAIILALVNHHRFDLGEYASMGTPDIGYIDGKYYSFFPPATSILAIPLYLLGTNIGIAQMLTFSISTIFALIATWMIYRFLSSLSVHWSAAIFGSFAFLFATNAWGYSVTLYAHLLSAASLVTGIYFATRKDINWLNTAVVWLLYAFAIFVDFPNIFTFFPIALLVGLRLFNVEIGKSSFKIRIDLKYLIGPIIFLACMCVYGYYNYTHFGDPLKFSNTIDRVKDLKKIEDSVPDKKGLDSVSALGTRKLLNGIYTFTISHDRGILIYSPVMLLFIFGLKELKKKDSTLKLLLVGVPLINLLTYSMFGDPYGGWAYGSRYMIAIIPELLVIAGMGLDHFARASNRLIKYSVLILYSVVFIYSSAISLMAPLTTNVIPPRIEAGTYALADDYRINQEMFRSSHLNSYVYNYYLKGRMSGFEYYYMILIPLNVFALIIIWWPKNKRRGVV